jgi:hypothetical protein
MKKAIISSEGRLSIIRPGNREVEITCPHRSITVRFACGEWCPHFGDPFRPKNGDGWGLDICQGQILEFDEIDDRRLL